MYSSNLVLAHAKPYVSESLSSRGARSYQGRMLTVPSQPVPLLWWLKVSKADVSGDQRGLSSSRQGSRTAVGALRY